MLHEPAFEIHTQKYSMLIFAEGRVELREGNSNLDANANVILNRIPQMLAKAASAARLSTFCTGDDDAAA